LFTFTMPTLLPLSISSTIFFFFLILPPLRSTLFPYTTLFRSLYAYDSSSPAHERCRNWLTEAFNGGEQIGLPWQTLLAFVRIATNSRALRVPLSGERACGIVAQWLTLPQVVVAAPGQSFWPIFVEQAKRAHVLGP